MPPRESPNTGIPLFCTYTHSITAGAKGLQVISLYCMWVPANFRQVKVLAPANFSQGGTKYQNSHRNLNQHHSLFLYCCYSAQYIHNLLSSVFFSLDSICCEQDQAIVAGQAGICEYTANIHWNIISSRRQCFSTSFVMAAGCCVVLSLKVSINWFVLTKRINPHLLWVDKKFSQQLRVILCKQTCYWLHLLRLVCHRSFSNIGNQRSILLSICRNIIIFLQKY